MQGNGNRYIGGRKEIPGGAVQQPSHGLRETTVASVFEGVNDVAERTVVESHEARSPERRTAVVTDRTRPAPQALASLRRAGFRVWQRPAARVTTRIVDDGDTHPARGADGTTAGRGEERAARGALRAPHRGKRPVQNQAEAGGGASDVRPRRLR